MHPEPVFTFRGASWLPPSPWTGRVDDPEDPLATRWHQVVEPWPGERFFPASGEGESAVCFIGLASDEGVRRNLGRAGTAAAPAQIRSALANLPRLFDSRMRLLDAGDIAVEGHDLESALEALAVAVASVSAAGAFPIVLGGGHEVALGHFEGLRSGLLARGRSGLLRVVNFDAHFDLRPRDAEHGANSGNSFSGIARLCQERGEPFLYHVVGIQQSANTLSLFRRAEELGVDWHLARHLDVARLPFMLELLAGWAQEGTPMHVSLCSDVFMAAHAPGVSAPQPFGLNPELVLEMMRCLALCGCVAGLDVAEVSPRFDQDNRTAHLVAVLLFAWVNALAERVGALR